MQDRPRISLISFILSVVRSFKWLIAVQFLSSFVWAANMSLRPYLLKLMIDKIPSHAPETGADLLWAPALAYLSMSALLVMIFRFYDWVRLTFRPYVKKYIAEQMMEQMMNHSHKLYQNQFSGGLANKINDVIGGVPNIIYSIVEEFSAQLLAIAIAIYTMSQVSLSFSLALFIWVAVFCVSSVFFAKEGERLANSAANIRSFVIGHIVDMLSNMMNIRLFSNQRIEMNHFSHLFDKSISFDQKRDWYFMKVYAFQGGSFVVFQALCLWLLIQGLKGGHVLAGDFVLILMLNVSLVDNLWSLSHHIHHFAEHVGNVTQGFNLIYSPIEIADRPDAKLLVVSKGEIVFDRVKFQYEGAEPLFQNKSVRILPGQKVGLVGYSGSGKSTFVNLILRLFETKEGHIFIDGQDICAVTLASLRQAISMIPQDPSLFHRSLFENIRYGKREASEEEVIHAAKLALAHDFISQLPEGYQSLVGERGIKLSGGQRQRIAIARALLKDAPILILDEATSQLDSIIESQIQQSLSSLMAQKTTIVIAHRLSTLLLMDRILVFDGGQIIQDGSHEQLLSQEGLYRTLWQTQVGGFLPKSR